MQFLCNFTSGHWDYIYSFVEYDDVHGQTMFTPSLSA